MYWAGVLLTVQYFVIMSFYWFPLCIGSALSLGGLKGVLPSFEANWGSSEEDFYIAVDGGQRQELLYDQACFDQQYMVNFNR